MNRASPLVKKHLQNLERIPNVFYERRNYLRLDKNENLIPFSKRFMTEVRKNITTDFISSYPEIYKLRKRIAKWIGCKQENIYISAGSDAAIKSVFEVYVRPKDKVLIINPTYAMYYVYARMFDGILLKIDYDKNLSLTIESLIKSVKNEKPRLICIANPNSPTGTIIHPNLLVEIIKIANNYSTVVLVDEAYYLYYRHSIIGLIDNYPNLVVTRTFSKAFGLASVRLGFAGGHRTMIANLEKVRPMYETNAFGVLLANLIFDNFSMIRSKVRETLESKAYLEEKLEKMGIKYYKSYTNFIVIDVGSYTKSCQIVENMKKNKILIGGAYKHPSLDSCIRITAGTKSDMKYFLKILKRYI